MSMAFAKGKLVGQDILFLHGGRHRDYLSIFSLPLSPSPFYMYLP